MAIPMYNFRKPSTPLNTWYAKLSFITLEILPKALGVLSLSLGVFSMSVGVFPMAVGGVLPMAL
jgi:hypothetical protein